MVCEERRHNRIGAANKRHSREQKQHLHEKAFNVCAFVFWTASADSLLDSLSPKCFLSLYRCTLLNRATSLPHRRPTHNTHTNTKRNLR